MMQKLFALANDKCASETPDNPMNQEILLGGHVYLLVLKVRVVFKNLSKCFIVIQFEILSILNII